MGLDRPNYSTDPHGTQTSVPTPAPSDRSVTHYANDNMPALDNPHVLSALSLCASRHDEDIELPGGEARPESRENIDRCDMLLGLRGGCERSESQLNHQPFPIFHPGPTRLTLSFPMERR